MRSEWNLSHGTTSSATVIFCFVFWQTKIDKFTLSKGIVPTRWLEDRMGYYLLLKPGLNQG